VPRKRFLYPRLQPALRTTTAIANPIQHGESSNSQVIPVKLRTSCKLSAFLMERAWGLLTATLIHAPGTVVTYRSLLTTVNSHKRVIANLRKRRAVPSSQVICTNPLIFCSCSALFVAGVPPGYTVTRISPWQTFAVRALLYLSVNANPSRSKKTNQIMGAKPPIFSSSSLAFSHFLWGLVITTPTYALRTVRPPASTSH
jgi:hypothetical protein